MFDDNLLKILIGVTSAFAGWILAQVTSSLKIWLQRRKILKLLLEELVDLDEEINRLFFFYARQLEIHGAMGVSSESTVGLSNPIFRGYYNDALLSLNQKQRISYQMIHSLVDLINTGITNLRNKSSEIYTRHACDGMTEELAKVCSAWGQTAKAQFLSCAGLQWQIRFHLQNRHGPDLSAYTESHEQFLIYLKDMQKKADEFVANGKTIERTKFDEVYDASTFSRSVP
ncbi:hypothetical protein [Rhodanobacter soli]|uniref:DUF4760 domain-containing protein n=1 Tax=Rhodanobacter soli TaxID=590609 RepID=A0ABV2PTZ1_9GAMM